MSLIRPRQRAITAVSPHNANSKYLIPKRTGGYRPLAWSTIPGQQFNTGTPAQVDFRQWLSGTNRQSATITAGDVYPAGFTFNNGVLSWDGTGNPSPGFEQSCIASDGEGPDTESGLFTVSVVDYTALGWSAMPDWTVTIGVPDSFDVRSYITGTNAATCTINGIFAPAGCSWDGSVLTYGGGNFPRQITFLPVAVDGIGPDAEQGGWQYEARETIDLQSQAFSINDKNGTLDSRDPDYAYVALSWPVIPNPLQFTAGTPAQIDVRSLVQGTNAQTATITINPTLPPPNGTSFDGDVIIYDGSGVADGPIPVVATASDGVGPDADTPSINVEVIETGGDANLNPGFALSAGIIGIEQTFTITKAGGGFGSLGPNILLFDDFRNQTPGQKATTSAVIGAWSSWSGSVARAESVGARSAGRCVYVCDSDDGTISWGKRGISPRQSEVFVHYCMKHPTGSRYPNANALNTWPDNSGQSPTGSNMKYAWFQYRDGSATTPGEADLCVPTQSGYGRMTVSGNENSMPNFQVVTGLDARLTFGGWITFSGWLKGPSTEWFAVSDDAGKPMQISNASQSLFGSAQGPFGHVNIPGYIRNAGNSNTRVMMDDVYLAVGVGAAARLEFTDNAIYSSSKKRAICTVTDWSDGQVSVTGRSGSFQAGDTVYLHFFNANNQNIYAGSAVL